MSLGDSWVFTLALAVLGALGGSVLNVVVHRGPTVWGLTDAPARAGRYDLSWPRSHCPACARTLAPWELVPILSWLALRGRCRTCDARISPRYPTLEAIGLAWGLLAALSYPAPAALPALVFLLLVVGAAAVDAETGYLPDALTGPALWVGLLASAAGLTVPPAAAIIGAATGYLSFRGIAAAYQAARGQEGLGRGDAKLLAAGGAWLGPFALPLVVFAAAVAGLAFALATGRREASAAVRFGPFLAAGIALGIFTVAAVPDTLSGCVVPAWPFG